jgi:fumarate hydratase subunit beta
MKRRREEKAIRIKTPLDDRTIRSLKAGDPIEIDGKIYCGRDAVLPQLVRLVENRELDQIKVNLQGSVIFHTAVSPAGIGPTTSNKVEIEGSIPVLSKAGVRIHLGKGSLGPETVAELDRNHSIFAITPPVTALFSDKILSQRVVAFKREGMEALYEVEVKGFPAIVAIAHGKTVFSESSSARRKKDARPEKDKRSRSRLPG